MWTSYFNQPHADYSSSIMEHITCFPINPRSSFSLNLNLKNEERKAKWQKRHATDLKRKSGQTQGICTWTVSIMQRIYSHKMAETLNMDNLKANPSWRYRLMKKKGKWEHFLSWIPCQEDGFLPLFWTGARTSDNNNKPHSLASY